MDTVLSVYNQKFAGDGEEFAKVSRAVGKAKSHFSVTNHGNLANLVKNYRLIAQKQTELQNELYDE